jgi:uncharacterized cupin superfamily protein
MSKVESPAPLSVGDMPLDTWGPKENATTGEPVESGVFLYQDDHVKVGVWECTPGAWPVAREGILEYGVILEGAGEMIEESGETQRLEPGFVVTLPDGWRGSWSVEQTLRKVFVMIQLDGQS